MIVACFGASDSSIARGRRINSDLVESGSVVVNLNSDRNLEWMRYWTLAEGHLWGRGQKDNRNNHASFYSGAIPFPRYSPGAPKRVVDDGGIAGTLGVRMVQGHFFGIGGEAFADQIRDANGANPPYDSHHRDERDGIYLLPFGSAASALSGSWRGCCHGSWMDRDKDRAPRIIDAYHKGCQSSLEKTWQTRHGSVHCQHGSCGCRYTTSF